MRITILSNANCCDYTTIQIPKTTNYKICLFIVKLMHSWHNFSSYRLKFLLRLSLTFGIEIICTRMTMLQGKFGRFVFLFFFSKVLSYFCNKFQSFSWNRRRLRFSIDWQIAKMFAVCAFSLQTWRNEGFAGCNWMKFIEDFYYCKNVFSMKNEGSGLKNKYRYRFQIDARLNLKYLNGELKQSLVLKAD